MTSGPTLGNRRPTSFYFPSKCATLTQSRINVGAASQLDDGPKLHQTWVDQSLVFAKSRDKFWNPKIPFRITLCLHVRDMSVQLHYIQQP